MLSGLQLQMFSYNIPVIQVGVREGRLLSVRKSRFFTPNTVSKPQFPQLFCCLELALLSSVLFLAV